MAGAAISSGPDCVGGGVLRVRAVGGSVRRGLPGGPALGALLRTGLHGGSARGASLRGGLPCGVPLRQGRLRGGLRGGLRSGPLLGRPRDGPVSVGHRLLVGGSVPSGLGAGLAGQRGDAGDGQVERGGHGDQRREVGAAGATQFDGREQEVGRGSQGVGVGALGGGRHGDDHVLGLLAQQVEQHGHRRALDGCDGAWPAVAQDAQPGRVVGAYLQFGGVLTVQERLGQAGALRHVHRVGRGGGRGIGAYEQGV
ncbi:hypothetical protein [Nocardiopsis sp. CNR-923]|uniref:hypothetical protein n=1 Tax=Nocardiopsis sp. CNR-923 TaxID=1904965 RepID=UPI0021CC7B9F|nr:hypothetical protein [Nocardiopsis sp. CNR-923]